MGAHEFSYRLRFIIIFFSRCLYVPIPLLRERRLDLSYWDLGSHKYYFWNYAQQLKGLYTTYVLHAYFKIYITDEGLGFEGRHNAIYHSIYLYIGNKHRRWFGAWWWDGRCIYFFSECITRCYLIPNTLVNRKCIAIQCNITYIYYKMEMEWR